MRQIKHLRFYDGLDSRVERGVNDSLCRLQKMGCKIINVTSSNSVYFAGYERKNEIIYTILYESGENI